jgi:cyanophycinase
MRYFGGAAGLLLVTLMSITSIRAADNLLGLPELALTSKGALMIVGGGQTTDEIRAEFIRLAGGPKARIVLIPSTPPPTSEECVQQYLAKWRKYPLASLDFLEALSRQEADSDQFVGPLQAATGIWMPGGRQERLIDLYGGTRVEKAIRRVLEGGGVVGGTSAGAAVMSRVMILEGTTCDAVTTRGFGLLNGAVVDQHFSQRGRHPRLMKVLEENPGLLGLGIDEDTALLVQGNHLRVLGEAHVTVFLPAEAYHATLVYRLKPGENVELTSSIALQDPPLRIALRKPVR